MGKLNIGIADSNEPSTLMMPGSSVAAMEPVITTIIQEKIVEVPIIQEKIVYIEKPIEIIKEVVKEIEVIKTVEVPVEIVKEIEVQTLYRAEKEQK
jgi:hypothetical protein